MLLRCASAFNPVTVSKFFDLLEGEIDKHKFTETKGSEHLWCLESSRSLMWLC